MDLTTPYLGLTLQSPIIAGASPLADDVDSAKRLEDAGIGAIVMYSLFEEQVSRLHEPALRAALASNNYVSPTVFGRTPRDYFAQIMKLKDAVDVPIIGSLNGVTEWGWLSYARQIANAGADALELNLYSVQADPKMTAQAVEKTLLSVAKLAIEFAPLPIAVKLTPYLSSPANFATELESLGVKGVILFNRFFDLDFDIERRQVVRRFQLSFPGEYLLRLRWAALLSGRTQMSIGLTGGAHTSEDVLKGIMAGAHAVQVVSCLLEHGPDYAATLVDEIVQWMEAHAFESLDQLRGTMNLVNIDNPTALMRANYLEVLEAWRNEIG